MKFSGDIGQYSDPPKDFTSRYDYHGFSVVVDEDSKSQEENKSPVKPVSNR